MQTFPNCTPVVGDLREQVSATIGDDVHHCITVEYQANENESLPRQGPWPVPECSMHDEAEQQARLVHLALWLVRPTALTFRTGAINSYGPTYSADENRSALTSEDLAAASKTFEAINSLSSQGPLRVAVLLATKALCDPTLEFRFLIMWLGMECLFGTKDGGEMTYRLAQRVALFLESDRAKANEVFKMVKDSYSLRSKIVHGFRVGKIDDEKFKEFSMDSETLLRRSLLTILDTATTIETFDGPTREACLDGLVFK